MCTGGALFCKRKKYVRIPFDFGGKISYNQNAADMCGHISHHKRSSLANTRPPLFFGSRPYGQPGRMPIGGAAALLIELKARIL